MSNGDKYRRAIFIFTLTLAFLVWALAVLALTGHAAGPGTEPAPQEDDRIVWLPLVMKYPVYRDPVVSVIVNGREGIFSIHALGCSSGWVDIAYTTHVSMVTLYHPECFDPDEQAPWDTVGANIYAPSLPVGTIERVTFYVYYPGGATWTGVVTGPWVVMP